MIPLPLSALRSPLYLPIAESFIGINLLTIVGLSGGHLDRSHAATDTETVANHGSAEGFCAWQKQYDAAHAGLPSAPVTNFVVDAVHC